MDFHIFYKHIPVSYTHLDVYKRQDLYDVEYAKEGKNYFLRIFIDKPEGIDLSDCEKVNDEINDLLDEANYIKDQYLSLIHILN